MIYLYRLFTFVVYLLVYFYGKTRARNGDILWQGRMGLVANGIQCDIWFHAASVGEVKVIGYLVAYLKKRRPDLNFYVTVMTEAGYKTANELFDDDINTGFFPLDVPIVINRCLSQINPSMTVFAETEIWPNFLIEVSKKNIPVILVNGRMSANSYRWYHLIRKSIKRLFNCYDHFFFKTECDARRYQSFYDSGEFESFHSKTTIAGDMKFDAPLMNHTKDHVDKLRAMLGAGPDDFVLVAGSTRNGEEKMLIDLYSKVREKHKNFRVVLVPRHVNRISEIKSLLEQMNAVYSIYGETAPIHPLVLVDKMGVLIELYQAADLAFVGGTLVNIGGHNLLEPVWAGTPVVFGPSLNNVKEAAEYIVSK